MNVLLMKILGCEIFPNYSFNSQDFKIASNVIFSKQSVQLRKTSRHKKKQGMTVPVTYLPPACSCQCRLTQMQVVPHNLTTMDITDIPPTPSPTLFKWDVFLYDIKLEKIMARRHGHYLDQEGMKYYGYISKTQISKWTKHWRLLTKVVVRIFPLNRGAPDTFN